MLRCEFQWSFLLDSFLLVAAYAVTWWCFSACTKRLSYAPQALIEASPYVLLPILLTVSSAVLGTLLFSMLMHAFAAANGTFGGSRLLSNAIGGFLCGVLLIPYQPKRFNVQGETPALRQVLYVIRFGLPVESCGARKSGSSTCRVSVVSSLLSRPFLYTATLAIPRLPGWSAQLVPIFLSLSVLSSLVLAMWRGHILLVSTFYILPHLVLDTWSAYYFLTMEKNGPRESRTTGCL